MGFQGRVFAMWIAIDQEHKFHFVLGTSPVLLFLCLWIKQRTQRTKFFNSLIHDKKLDGFCSYNQTTKNPVIVLMFLCLLIKQRTQRTKFFNSLIHDENLDGLLFLQSNHEEPCYCPLVLLSLFLMQVLLITQMFCLLKSARSAWAFFTQMDADF